MLHYQPVRRAARSALVVAGIAAYSVLAIAVMAAVFILAGA